jgi:hypothetical protein
LLEPAIETEVIMWLGQAKFFCTQCGGDVTASIERLIEQRCIAHSVDPRDLGEKAREAVNTEMLRELGEEPANPAELAFVKATALLLMEFAYSPVLLCDRCRSPKSGNGISERVKLRLLKGGREERK